MKTRTALALLLAGTLSASAATAPKVKLTQHDTTLDVTVDGKPFTTYHFNDNYFYEPVRPFLYPVLAGDGVGITTDQQQTDPKHGYQRSIWIGHADVNGANHWKFYAKPLPKQHHIKFDSVTSDSFTEELVWDDKDAKPMLHETRTMKFRAWPDGVRGIDVTMSFTPVAGYGDVTFGTHEEHGLLNVRLQESLYHTPTFTSAEGGACEIPPVKKPKGAALTTAETEDGAKSSAPAIHTAWCDESGKINSETYGATIFEDPANPRFPTLWHARPDARLEEDMFVLDKSQPVGSEKRQGPYTVAAGKTLTLHYEVIIHKGSAEDAKVKEKYAEFTGKK